MRTSTHKDALFGPTNLKQITLTDLSGYHAAAVAVIMTPVALDTAGLLGVEPKAFAVAVVVGAAATYLLPEGHPVPLMVQSPGSYETRDYLEFGTGLAAITLAIVAVLVP